MHPTPMWHADIELACPAAWPYDRLGYLTAALAGDKRIITNSAGIGKTGRRYSITASILLPSASAEAARALARTVLEQACAIARLPTGALINAHVRPAIAPASRHPTRGNQQP